MVLARRSCHLPATPDTVTFLVRMSSQRSRLAGQTGLRWYQSLQFKLGLLFAVLLAFLGGVAFYAGQRLIGTGLDRATFHEYGDLPVVLVVGDKQILVEATLVERNEFENPSEIDYRLLTTHKYLPLSTIAIDNIQGQDWYVLFGALSKHSKIEVIAEELDELVSNTFSVIDALEPLYKFNQKSVIETETVFFK